MSALGGRTGRRVRVNAARRRGGASLVIDLALIGGCEAAQAMHELPVTGSLENGLVVRAPDGSTVRVLCHLSGLGSFAHFQLEPGEVSRAVSHATVQEIWYIIGGTGRMWRHQEGYEPGTVDLRPGVCLTIPLGTTFQFRADSPDEPLQAVAVTMPPWPADSQDEARPEQGCWKPVLHY